MAHLWTQDATGWGAKKLDGAQLDLSASTSGQPAGPGQAALPEIVAHLVRADTAGAKVWAMIAPPGSDARLNGRTVPAGLCVLADRDEIRIGQEARYFSTETLAAVEAFPATERPVFCGRCRQQIEAESPAVCCPSCGVWYNQSDDLPCWIYSEKCTFCGHPTALDAGFTWTPEED